MNECTPTERSEITSQPVLIITCKPEEEESISEKLRSSLTEVCSKRNMPTLTINCDSRIDFLKIHPWAIINLGPANRKLRSVCTRQGFQFVSFTSDDLSDSYLKILTQQDVFTTAQINTVLDLMIDQVLGCRIFRPDETCFSIEKESPEAVENRLAS